MLENIYSYLRDDYIGPRHATALGSLDLQYLAGTVGLTADMYEVTQDDLDDEVDSRLWRLTDQEIAVRMGMRLN